MPTAASNPAISSIRSAGPQVSLAANTSATSSRTRPSIMRTNLAEPTDSPDPQNPYPQGRIDNIDRAQPCPKPAFSAVPQTRVPGPDDGLGPVGDVELGEDVGHDVAHRFR